MSESSMEQKCALVTGASGGIGEAFVHLLAARGYRLMICARNDDELNRVAGIASSKHETEVTAVPLDLIDPDSGDVLSKELARRGLSPDVVINNAGFGLAGPAFTTNVDAQLDLVDLNVRCVTDLSLRFLPAMIERGTGGVINVSSIAAFLPGPNMATYFASKAYVTWFTDALHEELKGTGVTATTLCPGPVRTEFQARSGMDKLKVMKFARMQTPEFVAEAGWQGFEAGERLVIPGKMNRFFAYASRLAPRAITLPAVKALQSVRADSGQ